MNPRLRLLHVFPSFELGGSQSRFVRLVTALGDDIHHRVLSMSGDLAASNRLRGQSNVSFETMAIRRGRTLGNMPSMIRSLRQSRPDRLLTYNFGSVEWMYANAFVRVPHVHVEDGFGPDEIAARLWRRSALRAIGLRIAGARLVVASEGLADIARREWRVPARRLQRAPNGVDTSRFGDAGLRGRASVHARSGEFVVGTVAGLRAEKRIDRLIDAFGIALRRMPMRLVIAGDGAQRDRLEKHAAGSGLADRVVFLGRIERPEDLLGELDAFAITSDTEQTPMALLEAMAAGLPIVSTRVGDLPSILPEAGHRFLTNLDPGSIADALVDMASNAELRRMLGEANRRHVRESYSAEVMLDCWNSIWRGQ